MASIAPFYRARPLLVMRRDVLCRAIAENDDLMVCRDDDGAAIEFTGFQHDYFAREGNLRTISCVKCPHDEKFQIKPPAATRLH